MPPEPAGHDLRYQDVDEAMRRHHHRPDSLIEVLHTAQRLFGYLPAEVLAHVARGLAVPPSTVYGVATFYHFFTLAPKGRHTITVCTGTACYVRRAGEILRAVERTTGVSAGGTRADRAISVEAVRCLGPCSQAPVVVFDDEVTGELSTKQVLDRLQAWVKHES